VCTRQQQRAVKSASSHYRPIPSPHPQIACLLEANRVSAAAHEAIWTSCRVGMFEYQLESAFRAACMDGGLRQLGYPCIVSFGFGLRWLIGWLVGWFVGDQPHALPAE